MPAPAGPSSPLPATAEFDKERHIVINSKVYEREAFNEEQVAAISAVNYADQHIASAEQDLKVYKFGRDQMVKQLLDTIESVPSVGSIEPPAAQADEAG